MIYELHKDLAMYTSASYMHVHNQVLPMHVYMCFLYLGFYMLPVMLLTESKDCALIREKDL